MEARKPLRRQRGQSVQGTAWRLRNGGIQDLFLKVRQAGNTETAIDNDSSLFGRGQLETGKLQEGQIQSARNQELCSDVWTPQGKSRPLDMRSVWVKGEVPVEVRYQESSVSKPLGHIMTQHGTSWIRLGGEHRRRRRLGASPWVWQFKIQGMRGRLPLK